MLSWLWKNGNTKTEKLPEEPKVNNPEKVKKVNKYKNLLKKYRRPKDKIIALLEPLKLKSKNNLL